MLGVDSSRLAVGSTRRRDGVLTLTILPPASLLNAYVFTCDVLSSMQSQAAVAAAVAAQGLSAAQTTVAAGSASITVYAASSAFSAALAQAICINNISSVGA